MNPSAPQVELTVEEIAALRRAVEDQRRCRHLLETWEAAHVSPLLVAELAEALGAEPGSRVEVTKYSTGEVVRVLDRWRYPS